MRQPPSPLLLSARKRRPRRNQPHGVQYGSQPEQAPGQDKQQAQQAATSETEKCALLERGPGYASPARPEDDETTASSR
jgi:hypothetical protein